jgi:hypothetical protein
VRQQLTAAALVVGRLLQHYRIDGEDAHRAAQAAPQSLDELRLGGR